MNEATQTAPITIGATTTAFEEMPSLADFADEPSGAWPNGWYHADIIGGYATTRGKQITTSDSLSGKGDSRNMKVCFKLTGPLGTRNTFESFNYRTNDFTPERLAQIKDLREQFRGTRGAWPGQSDAQRTSLAIAQLGQFEKALGFRLTRTPDGNLNPTPFIGQSMDIRLGTDEKGYNTITAFAALGTRVK